MNISIKHKVLVVIPVLNEEKNIGYVLDELSNCCNECDVLVVNDGSTDGSLAV